MSEIVCLENVGRITNVARSIAQFEWQIPDCSNLLQILNDRINSPPFTFLNATWYLSMVQNAGDWIALYIIKKHSTGTSCHVNCTLGIRNANGSIYRSWQGEKTFCPDGSGDGRAEFSHREAIFSNSVAPQGTLDVFCVLHAVRASYNDMTIQTELYKGNDECIQMNENDLSVHKYKKSVSIGSSGLDKTLEDFKDLLLSGEDCDVILKVKDQEFKAHRLILRTRSPVFRSMFQHRMKEETSGIIDVTDCDPAAFKDFLYYLYCGRVEELSTNNVFDLYRIGDKYDVQDLKEICLEFMMYKISVISFPEVIVLALQYSESDLIERATNFFIENATEISETAKWIPFVTKHPVEANELFRKSLKPPKK